MDLRIPIALMVTLLVMPAQASELGVAYVKLFNTQAAIAEKGSPGDVYNLGQMYEQGLGTKQDLNKARDLYAKAAEKGELRAKRKLRIWDRAAKKADDQTEVASVVKKKEAPAKKVLTQEQKRAAWKKAMAASLKRAETEESDMSW